MHTQDTASSIIVGTIFKTLIWSFLFYVSVVVTIVVAVCICLLAGQNNTAHNVAMTAINTYLLMPFVVIGCILHTVWKLVGGKRSNAPR